MKTEDKCHWVVDLNDRLKLPVLPEVVRALRKATEERMTLVAKRKTDKAKRKEISHKSACAEDQEERNKWVKRQAVIHTYGEGDAGGDAEKDPSLVRDAKHMLGHDGATIVSGKKFRCGPTSHQHTSSRSCPLNKNSAK